MTNEYSQTEVLLYYILRGLDSSSKLSLNALTRIIGKSRTTVKRAIKRLRMDGAPIISTSESPGGYWWAQSKEDIEEESNKLTQEMGLLYERKLSLLTNLDIAWEINIDS